MQAVGAFKRVVKDSGLITNLVASVIVVIAGALLSESWTWYSAGALYQSA